MQHICPLENKSFLSEQNESVIKHLKKCPLFLKYLYFHYNPFYFSHVNDSLYLLEGSNIENILSEYYDLFNKLIDIIKKYINITNYEQFLELKYNILLKYYLKYGKNDLIKKFEENSFFEKLKRKIHNDNESQIDINLNNADDFLTYYIDKLKLFISEKRRNNNDNNEIKVEEKNINKLIFFKNKNNETYEKKEDFFYETNNIKKNNNVVNEENQINNFFTVNSHLKKKNRKYTLPILNLENIGKIHNYKIIRDIVNFIDANIFLNEKINKETNSNNHFKYNFIDKENFNKDEVLSIVIYLTIYLCCKTNIIKRIKNKTFNREDNFDNLTMSIYFFLENLDKHDIQNINMLFLLLYFNDTFSEYFKNLFNQINSFINDNKYNLFIELGAGKGNTTRWLNFVMNNLGEIVKKFYFNMINKIGNKNSDGKCNENEFIKENLINDNKNTIDIESQKERCKIMIIEKESVRNKKEKKDFFMNIVQNNSKDMYRIKADISDFNLSKFIYLIRNGIIKSENMFIPDIINFYYFKDIYKKKKLNQLNNNVMMENEKKEHNELNNNTNFLISEDYLKSNLIFIQNYFDINIKKLYCFLTQGNNNILKFVVYNNMNTFLSNFDCQRVIFLTKHLCGNGTDLALRMLINNAKNNDVENYFILAPCCHHRCDVERVLGFKYLKKLNIDKKYFQYMVNHMSGYASCNSKIKQSIGKKVKQLLDLSRILYLLEEGLQNVYLIKYVNRNITLESYAIVFFNHQKLNLRNFKYY
ncbi:conserved Plasmodium protein, unknown function [Plasmodium gallinaceum]|uniref:tRNA:m(4)X modification enzyme TRM13 n=1 Tax=Plasmodium gallinaceum TaxID=5849 RepID=A0A1J1GVL2_PLAGA|nr:conserved Plasmodium protein, unknown function [Plasmodium gallinaceum]CRG96356.1 conserved Plasmodium protein, unknown function [Plasmodium gallinaceum]